MNIKKIMQINNILSGKFWVSAALAALLCLCGRFQADPGNGGITIIQALFQYSKAELLDLGGDASSFCVSMSFRDSDWFVVLLPFIASFPKLFDLPSSGSVEIIISIFQEKRGKNMTRISGQYSTLVTGYV